MRRQAEQPHFNPIVPNPAVCNKSVLPWFFAVLFANALSAQTMTISPAGNPNEQSYQVSGLPWRVQTVSTPDSPFHWIFTLYGNGEYGPLMPYYSPFCWVNYPFPGFRAADTTFRYTYPSATSGNVLTFNPIGYVTSRKGDPPPPPPPTFYGVVSGGPFTTTLTAMGTRAATMPSGKSVYLAHSHGFLTEKAGYNRSVFILSYKTTECTYNQTSKMRLFYGARRGFTGIVRSAHLVGTAYPLPNYYNGQPVVGVSSFGMATGKFVRQDLFNIPAGYIGGVSSATGALELRLFGEVMYYNNSTLGGSDWSFALAMITTPNTNCACPLNRLTLEFAASLLDSVDIGNCTYGGERIVDLDTIYLKKGEPVDPNNIVFTKICRNGDLEMELMYCNLPPGTAKADSSSIRIDFIDPNFEWCNKDSLELPIGSPMSIIDCVPPNSCPPQAGQAVYHCGQRTVRIKKDLDLGRCAKIDLYLRLKSSSSLVGNPSALLAYLQSNVIVKGTVFLNDSPLKVENTKLDTYGREEGDFEFRCPNKTCEGTCPW